MSCQPTSYVFAMRFNYNRATSCWIERTYPRRNQTLDDVFLFFFYFFVVVKVVRDNRAAYNRNRLIINGKRAKKEKRRPIRMDVSLWAKPRLRTLLQRFRDSTIHRVWFTVNWLSKQLRHRKELAAFPAAQRRGKPRSDTSYLYIEDVYILFGGISVRGWTNEKRTV